MKLKIAKLNEQAKYRQVKDQNDVGLDIWLTRLDKICGSVFFFGTSLAIEPPEGFYCELVPRSSIAKTQWALANSVGKIDPGYRGEILVPLRHMSEVSVKHAIKELTKEPIVQLVLRKYYPIETEDVDFSELSETARGSGGFGSTDNKG